MPSRYRVAVACWEQPPTHEESIGKNFYMPEPYRKVETSKLEVAIPARSGSQHLELDVPGP